MFKAEQLFVTELTREFTVVLSAITWKVLFESVFLKVPSTIGPPGRLELLGLPNWRRC